MGKITLDGFPPKNDPMFSGRREIFSRPESNPSSTSSAKSTTGETQASKSSVPNDDRSTSEVTHRGSDALEKSLMDWMTNGPSREFPMIPSKVPAEQLCMTPDRSKQFANDVAKQFVQTLNRNSLKNR